jgi:hypothetical protein
MKKFYLLSILLSLAVSAGLKAQNNVYTKSIIQSQINLRGGAINLGELNIQFPTDGFVVVHFDGECYATVGDRIVLAASNDGSWTSNDGNVAVETSIPGFGRPFSHTRLYPVTAGSHNYYAVGQNAAETDGNGVATIYGTLTVEYFPDSGTSFAKATGFVFNGDVTNTTAIGQQTIHVTAPGKVVVRFDGFITSSPADRIVLAASNTMSWGFNDGNVAVEAVNAGDVDENSFSHTRVYNVSSAGDYTYYALAQIYGKAGGNGMIGAYGNLLVEFFPTAGAEKIFFTGFTLPLIDLNGFSTPFDSVSFNFPEAGKVLLVLDGYLTADPGYDIVLAASNNGEWSENDGHLTLQALDNDNNRYSFSHSRLFNVGAGQQTFYAVGQIFGGSGSKTADLFGELTLKYIPNSLSPVFDLSAGENTFDLYPNPSRQEVHIVFKNPIDQNIKIEILDVNGRVLREYSDPPAIDIKIDISTLPSDLYWIKVGEIIKPLVKM